MFIVIGSAVTGKSAFCCTNHANIYASQSTYLNYSILNNYISKGCIGLKPYLLQYQQHHHHHYSTHPTHKPIVYPLTKGDGCPPLRFFPGRSKTLKKVTSDLGHLSKLFYILCGHFDEKCWSTTLPGR